MLIQIFESSGNPGYITKHGKRKCFHKGGNSSCRQHIRQHYEIYQERCKAQGITENHRAIPTDVIKAREEEVKINKTKKQMKLESLFDQVKGPREFSRENVLHAVTHFIVCDDQV